MGTDATVKPKEGAVEKKGDALKEKELSEEDEQLQDELNMLLERLKESNLELHKPALESMCTIIKSSTTSMTSVPKPLKFLTPHYPTLKDIYRSMSDFSTKKLFADVISVLGMTVTDKSDSTYDTLNYRLDGTGGDIGAWGHEYVRHLTSQVVSIWQDKDLDTPDDLEGDVLQQRDQYLSLVNSIIPYLLDHNAESEAIDLCVEIEQLQLLEEYTSKINYQRVCLYLTSCVAYLPDPDNTKVLTCAANLYRKFDDLGNAMRCALRLNDIDLVQTLFTSVGESGSLQRQLAYLLGKHGLVLPDDDILESDEDLTEMLRNTRVSEHFLSLGRELDILEAKVPDDIYKVHLETVRPTLSVAATDTARANLASSYVSGLVNCGFCEEKLVQTAPEMPWLRKHKDMGKMSTVATLGWVHLWDVDNGLSQLDKYLYMSDEHFRAGGLLGCGLLNCGIKHECDPALGLLVPFVDSKGEAVVNLAAIIGLGVAYSGSMREEVIKTLIPVILDTNTARLQHACLAALSAGLICVGSLNAEVTSTIIQTMLDRPESHWTDVFCKFLALGLALTCLGRQEEVEVILASLEAVAEPMKSMAHMMCDFCAYAGSGNVLKVQNLLHILSEKYDDKKQTNNDSSAGTAAATTKSKSGGSSKTKTNNNSNSNNQSVSENTRSASRASGRRGRSRDTPANNANNESPAADESAAAGKETAMDTSEVNEGEGSKAKEGGVASESQQEEEETDNDLPVFDFHAHQGLAVIGIAAIAMGEEVGLDMAFRIFGHLLRFGELPIKRAVPLALALCNISNPQLKVLDTLGKFSHDADAELSNNSVLALGLVGAGTNNARLAAMLRQLAVYHNRDPSNLFLVRLAQGLVHLGKGTLTLSPWHSDHSLIRPVGLAGLLILMVSCLDVRSTFMNRHDYLIFYLTPAIQPRLLMTFSEDLKPLQVPVRVGQAVDVVGQAGMPKTITGCQTHTTPVLLSHGERAELATEEYLPVSCLPFEGFVLLKKNPDYEGSVA